MPFLIGYLFVQCFDCPHNCRIGDNCLLYHGVLLGGVSLAKKKRHPTLGSNVVVGAGAKILGAITLGDGVQVGANAVVLKDVPPDSVVVGIPGRVVKQNGTHVGEERPLTHGRDFDPEGEMIKGMLDKIEEIENRVRSLEEDDRDGGATV